MLICPLLRGRCSVNCLFNSTRSEITSDKKDKCILYGAVLFLNTFNSESTETDEARARKHFAELMNDIRRVNGLEDDYEP